ncbi:MAG: carboxypeptidase regulatory-like domain-containing protein [Thermoplasmata archaeon]|nr:carboxypeptidase regulatory-like domain-containing protein [Thermoplasmata archaeon]
MRGTQRARSRKLGTFDGRRRWSSASSLAIAVGAFMALPLLPGMGAASAAAPIPGAVGHTGSDLASVIPPSAAHLAGTDPTHEPFVDVGRWVAEAPNDRGGLPLSSPSVVGPNTTSGPLAAAASPRASPRPLAAGTISGNVFDPHFGTPIPNVNVTVHPLAGGSCIGLCLATTNGSGGFRVAGPAGPAVRLFTHVDYIDNRSWTTVPLSGNLAIGSIDLVHVGYAKGVVELDVPGTPPATNVGLQAISRDGLIATPGSGTAPNGSFLLAVPPVPSRIDLTPGGNDSLANFTFVDAGAYAVVDLGILYIENATPLHLAARDAVTGATITPGQVQVCSRVSGACFVGNVGPPGPDIMKVFRQGYVVNITTLPDVPKSPALGYFDVGTVELMPEGLVNLTVGLTGGPPPPATWTVGPGVGTIVACSLDGLTIPKTNVLGPYWKETDCQQANYTPGIPVTFAAMPLRDIIYISPLPGTAPIESELVSFATSQYEWGNITWVNVTADRMTNLSFVNMTAGAYVEGRVALDPTGTPTSNYTVRVCSTDEPRCMGGGPGSASDPGCTTGPGWFCAASPPGPVEVTVTGTNGGVNRTWAFVDPRCCHLAGHPVNVGWVNLTAVGRGIGSVSGHVYVVTPGGGPQEPAAGLFAEVEVCAAGPAPAGSQCQATFANNTTGAFNLTAQVGWDRVSVYPQFYETNSTWIDVTGANSTGDIYLAPSAVLAGQVLVAGGGGAIEAHVAACPIGQVALCRPVGPNGLTGTNGQYSGSVRGGPLPWGTYEVIATASGYAANWSWVNTSAGALSVVPPITLSPIGNGRPAGSPGLPRGLPAPLAGSGGSWVAGRAVDARRGYGVAGAEVVGCPILGLSCVVFTDVTNTGGGFNGTVPPGAYQLFVNATTYAPTTVFLNATAGGTASVGVVDLTPLPAVLGRVAIGPWASLTTVGGLGPDRATVLLCANSGAPCGPLSFVDTGGYFNVSGPAGIADSLQISGGGGGPAGGDGTAPFGFSPLGVSVDVTKNLTQLPTSGPTAVALAIFGGIAGTERDGGTWNASRSEARDPIHFGYLASSVAGVLSGATACTPGGGGNYLFLEPRGGSRTTIEGLGGGFLTANVTIPGSVVAGSIVGDRNVTEPHFGWVRVGVRDATTGAPIPFADVTVLRSDLANGTNWVGAGQADGAGVANVTAPPGTDLVLITSRPYYLGTNFTATVTESTTSPLGRVNLTENPFPDTGVFFRTYQVNTVNATPVLGAVDRFTGAPLPSARVIIVDANGGIINGPTTTNDLGQFFAFGPPPNDIETLVVQMPAYAPFRTSLNLSHGGSVTLPYTNLTGDGIVAGSVVAYPGRVPVANVSVQVCPANLPICPSTGATNGAGAFAIAAPPGLDVVTVIANGYATNYTVAVNLPTDTWVTIGHIPVFTYATVTGRLIGIPTGQAIVNGNISVCSSLGFPSGPCFIDVASAANGSFSLPAPPGSFVIRFSAPLYNSSFLNLSILPGAKINVGVQFLFAYGSIYGTVDALPNGVPIAGAAIRACATWAGGPCAGLVISNATGRFAVNSPPGPVQLDVSAAGFNDNFTTVVVPVGGTAFLPSVNLTPLPSTLPIPLVGTVVTAADPTHGLAGAVISALQFGTAVASAQSNATGGFSLTLYYGTFTLIATESGYHPSATTVILHAPRFGLFLLLATMTYPVQGVVRDRSNGAAVPNARILGGGLPGVTTDAAGYFTLALPNGSYALTAEGPNASAVAYSWVNFTIQVNGAPVRHDLTLNPSGYAVLGLVVDALTGLPLSGASVAVVGNSSTGVLVRTAQLSHVDGRFGVTLPPGSYVLTTNARGYGSNRTVLVLNAAPAPVTVALDPLSALVRGSAAWERWIVPVAGGTVAVALAVAVVYWVWRRRRGPTFSVPAQEARSGGTGYRFEAPPGEVLPPPLPPTDDATSR